jgi:hypothetical protein
MEDEPAGGRIDVENLPTRVEPPPPCFPSYEVYTQAAMKPMDGVFKPGTLISMHKPFMKNTL